MRKQLRFLRAGLFLFDFYEPYDQSPPHNLSQPYHFELWVDLRALLYFQTDQFTADGEIFGSVW